MSGEKIVEIVQSSQNFFLTKNDKFSLFYAKIKFLHRNFHQ